PVVLVRPVVALLAFLFQRVDLAHAANGRGLHDLVPGQRDVDALDAKTGDHADTLTRTAPQVFRMASASSKLSATAYLCPFMRSECISASWCAVSFAPSRLSSSRYTQPGVQSSIAGAKKMKSGQPRLVPMRLSLAPVVALRCSPNGRCVQSQSLLPQRRRMLAISA